MGIYAKPLLTALTVACAFGAGVTGTLLWMEVRPQSAPGTAPSPPPASRTRASRTAAPSLDLSTIPKPNGASPAALPADEIAPSGVHVPPAALTNGMRPPEASLTLGNWHYDHEQWDLAVENYRSAIKGGVDNPNIRTDLGNALRFSDRPQEALKQYQLAQQQDPTHEQSLFNQGALYAVSLKNPRRGIQTWRAYLTRFPQGSSASQARELMAKYSSSG